jgi:hypothetical protein
MSLLNYIKSMFGVNLELADNDEIELQESQESKDQQLQPIGTILYMLMPNGEINLSYECVDNDIKLAPIFAKFLYHINQGDLEPILQQSLIQHANTNMIVRPFIEAVCREWVKLQEEHDDIPAVDPRAIFSMSSNLGNTNEQE